MNKKQRLLILLLLLLFGATLYFNQPHVFYNGNDIRCVDGDTFWLKQEKVRLLVVDSPELDTHDPYSQEARQFTCNTLRNAESITVQTDRGNEMDQYGRHLYWVYVDGKLLQTLLVENGYARIRYVDAKTINRTILDTLKKAEHEAQAQELGIWKP